VLMVTFMTLDYHILGNVAVPTYLVVVGLLVVVAVLGRVTHGAARWIQLGFFDLQPSELGKLIVAIALARYVADHQEEMHRPTVILRSLLIVIVPAGLTLVQPDFGTAALFLVIWLGVMVVGGMRWLHLGLMALAGVAAAPVVWMNLHDYQRERVLTFLNPQREPLGAGYNPIQALISVGSGGPFGRGFTSGTQSQLHFLRVQYADFIFSVLAEELGFIGAVVLLALFAILLLRGLRSAATSRDPFGRLLAAGVVSWLGVQVFVNIGMNLGLVPVAGVPLPLISYGGSSLLAVLAAVGVLQSVAMHRQGFEL
jgi:rod shape determining protein RodA